MTAELPERQRLLTVETGAAPRRQTFNRNFKEGGDDDDGHR
ncbi:hypothetical protein [Candidatus Poriferisodalis sp.]